MKRAFALKAKLLSQRMEFERRIATHNLHKGFGSNPILHIVRRAANCILGVFPKPIRREMKVLAKGLQV
jgi:hypothetical protein